MGLIFMFFDKNKLSLIVTGFDEVWVKGEIHLIEDFLKSKFKQYKVENTIVPELAEQERFATGTKGS